jgi:hypothetical protein
MTPWFIHSAELKSGGLKEEIMRNLGNFVFIGFLVSVFFFQSGTLFAEDSGDSSSTAKVSGSSNESVRMSAGFGVGYSDSDFARANGGTGTFGPEVNVGLLHQVGSSAVYVGIDFGVTFLTYNQTSEGNARVENGAYGVSVLPSFIYRLKFPNQTLAPYFGFSIGPQIYIKKVRTLDLARNTADSSSSAYVYFQFMARPGVDIMVADGMALSLESKFGFLGADFIWLPQANITILL